MKVFIILAFVALATASPLRLVGRDNSEVSCSICQHLTQQLHGLLADDTAKTAVKTTLLSRCDRLVSGQNQICNDIVHSMSGSMVEHIVNKIHPYEVCSTLEMCPMEHNAAVHSPLVLEHHEEPSEHVDFPVNTCEFCQFAVNVVERWAHQNGSIPKLNETLYQFCNSLPDVFKSECLQFAPAVIKALAEGVPPHQACVSAHVCPQETVEYPLPWKQVTCGICNGVTENMFGEDAGAVCMDMGICMRPTLPARERELTPQPEVDMGLEHPEAGPGCELCEFVVNVIDQYLKNNKSEAAINATITKVCNELPEPLKDTCNGFAPQLVKILSEGFDPKQACTKIGLCATEAVEEIEHEMVEHEEEHEEAGPGCELCEFVVNVIDQYLKNNKSEAAINATITKVCNELPEPLKDTCNGFAPQLIKILSEGLDPQQACSIIGLCMTAELEVEPLTSQIDEAPNAGPGCELCQFVVNVIDQYLKNNKSEAAINATITKICNELPEPLKDTCTGFAPQLVKILSDGFDPKQACTKIGLCETSPIEEHPTLTEEQFDRMQAGPGCELCEFVVNVIDQYLKNNKSEAAINATITKVCNELPEPLKDTCNGFAPQLVKILSEGFDPKQACTKIGLCATEEEPEENEEAEFEVIPEEEEVSVNAGSRCFLCKFVVNVILPALRINKSEAAINATITKVCNQLPQPQKDTCKGFAPQLVKILSEGYNPKQACTKIGLCATSSHPVEKHEVKEPVSTSHEEENRFIAGPGCELCQFVVNVIDQYLKNNKSEAAINATITKICNELPEPLKDTCTGFAPQLVKILSDGFDPKQACTKIGLCSSNLFVTYAQVTVTPECHLCELVVKSADKFLAENSTVAYINTTILNICLGLPDPLKSTCMQHAPSIVEALADGVDPNMTCTKIKLCYGEDVPVYQFVTCDVCHSSMERAFPQDFKKMCRVPCKGQKPVDEIVESFAHEAAVALKKPVKGLACQLCTLLVNTLDQYLKNNHSEAAINSTLYKICDSLPAALKLECHVMAPLLVKELAHGFNATKACTAIHACTTQVPEEVFNRAVRAFQSDFQMTGEDTKCKLCKDLIGIIDMGINGDENKTHTMFDDICHRLPPPTDQKCLDFVDPNFPKIWKEIVDGKLSPGKVCETIKLCKQGNSTL